MVILLELVPIAKAENTILIENFDKINIGSIPNEWELAQIGQGDQAYVQDSYTISGERTLYIKESGGDDTNIKLLSEKFNIADFEYSFKFRIVGILQARAVFSLLNNDGEVCILINCRAGDNWRYFTNEGTWNNIPNLPTPLSGQVYNVKMVVDSKSEFVNVIVNDVESGGLHPYKTWDELAQISFSSNYNFPSEFWIDDILIEFDEPVEKKSSITIKKIVDWGYKTQFEDDTSFTFQSSWDDEFSLENGEQDVTTLQPGIYKISEVLQNGWDLNEIKIEDSSGGSYKQNPNTVIIDIEENDKVIITFVNRPPDFVIPETSFGTLSIILVMIFVLILLKNS